MNSITNNTMLVKQMNQEKVRQALIAMKTATKAMVAQATSLSIATCNHILNELLDAGEVLEVAMDDSKGGRPAKMYQYNMHHSYIIAAVIKTEAGSRSLTYAIANMAGEIVDQGYEEHNRIDLALVDRVIERLILQYPQIRAVGIGVPGAVDQGVINVSDIPELINIPLEAFIREKHKVEVILENDMNLTVYGFYHKQGYDERQTVAVVTFIDGSLPGAGMMVDGRIHRGFTRFAGEIAFLPLGISQEAQFQQLHDRKRFHVLAAHSVASLIAILNPETIALTGSLVRPADVNIIRQECLKYIPDMHMPQMISLDHPDQDYMYGLIARTLESLAYSLELVEKGK